MPNDNIQLAIDAAAEGNAAEFETHIGSALMDKVRDRLELKRIEIASTMFNGAPESEETENGGQ
jgi:hypothetical protein